MGWLSADGYDDYTVASYEYRSWLPEAEASPGPTRNHRFMLEAPSAAAETIMLSDLKTRIAQVEAEVAAGGASTEYTAEEYRECIFEKYRNQRKVDWMGEYYNYRTDVDVASGAPEGTHVYWYPHAGEWLAFHGEQQPSEYRGEDWVGGRDAALFTGGYPFRVTTARPLPAGEYRFYYASIWHDLSICDAMAKEQKERNEYVVTVTRPANVLHEAFFDPVTIGAAVGADGANGVIKPSDFSVGGNSVTITGLKWENGVVVLTLSPYVPLGGAELEFIALDGSVALSLLVAGAAADATAGTLTWNRAERPWQNGDELMFRIRGRR